MIGPSSHVSKLLLTLFFILLLFFVFMDVSMYLRIQNYPIALDKLLAKPTKVSKTESDSIDSRNSSTFNDDFSRLDPVSFRNVISSTNKNTVLQRTFGPDSQEYESVTWIPCDINPLCYPTVKGLMLDHTNHYLFAPLVSVVDNIVGISRNMLYITPNMISYFHVVLAMLAGKLVSMDVLAYRRIGVLLFEVRTFLDDLDGHVARSRKHIKGERSEVGTAGYYIDGVCDLLGCIFLIIGVFYFLKNNPPRRGYVKVHTVLPHYNETNVSKDGNGADSNGEVGFVYKPKVSMENMLKKLFMFSGQLLLSSIAWNRYIDIYQETLEKMDDVSANQGERQIIIFRSDFFFAVAWLWKIVNVHCMLHFILFAIFCDKLWEFMRFMQFSGYAILISSVCLTEMHVIRVQNYVYNNYQ